MSSYRVALLGAAGAVGQELLRVLVDRHFPVSELKLLATSRSAGHKFTFRGEELTVEEVSEEAFRGVDICFFAAGNEASKVWAPVAVRAGAVVIDKASVFRMEKEIPLVRHFPQLGAIDDLEPGELIPEPAPVDAPMPGEL